MVSLYLACLSSFISTASTLNVAPQGSIATFSDTSTSSLNLTELLYPSNQSTSWSNRSFTPANPPPLPANISALQALGLDANKPISWETTPSGNVVGVQCNTRYGRRLDFQDCRNAYSFIPRLDERIARFAQRGSGLPHDIALPQRVLGSKGKCSINPFLILPYESGTASAKNIADSAYALIERCAPRSGGIAINIGGDNHLAVVLEPYAPAVRCEGSGILFSRESCAMIERGMLADERQRLFGDDRLDPQVEEPLPYELLSSDERCAVTIFSNGDADVETWYHLWEATVALNAMCVRAGKRGTATGLGVLKNLFIEISNQPSQPSLSSVGDVNGTAAERV